VVGEEGKSHGTHLVAVAGAGECAEDDAVEQGRGSEEQAALEGSGGDFHESAAFWNEAKRSGHGKAAVEQAPRQPWIGS